MAGSTKIIAVDVNSEKFEIAKKLGATDCVNPKELDVLVQKHIAGTMTDWGVDYSFDCTGNGKSAISSFFCTNANGKFIILFSSLLIPC